MDSINEISEKRKNWIFEILQNILNKNQISKLGILGYTYKKDNSSYKNSPTINLLKNLKKYKLNIGIYDDLINITNNSLNIKFYKDPRKMIKDCDLLIFMRDFKNKKKIENINYIALMKKKFILDPFGNFENTFNKKANFKYIKMGKKYE